MPSSKSAAAHGTLREVFDEELEAHKIGERCRRVVEQSVSAGADEAEAYAVRSQSVAVRFEKGDLKLAQVDDGSTLGLRTFRDKRLGFCSTNQGDEGSLAALAHDTLVVSAFAPPDEANRLPGARPISRSTSLVEPALAAVEVDTIVEIGRSFLERVKAVDPRLSIDSAACEFARVSHAVHSSAGVRCAQSDASISLQVFGMAIDGADVGGFHYGGDAVRRLADVEAALQRVIEDFTRIALGNLDAQKAESYTGPVLFSPSAFLSAFISPLLSAASAIAVQRGRSALADRIGDAVATDVLDVSDDPTDATLAGAGAFDREGQPTARFPIVASGVLQSYLYNGYAACVAGRTSTGHARGGARSVPGLGVHATVVGPGSGGDVQRMLAHLSRGLYVERFSGTVDPSSGDFSGVAKSSRWVEGGAIVRPVRETLLSGNAFRLLKQILALSSANERVMGSARAPFALIDGVAVTAG